MINLNDLFWNASITELQEGYIFNNEKNCYICLICGKSYQEGQIFPLEEQYFDAKTTIKKHLLDEHKSMFNYLISLNRQFNGLSEQQKRLLPFFYEGLTDKEIVAKLENNSSSTIRGHRFKLKEKKKQSTVFLAIMGLLEQKMNQEDDFVVFHPQTKMQDERSKITNKEHETVLKSYFKQGLLGPLHSLPSKQKRKLIVLKNIIEDFKYGQKYNEKEVNNVLKLRYPDYVTLRRLLIEYGFLEREVDGSIYWRKI